MISCVQRTRSLLPALESALDAFTSSSAAFQIIWTGNAANAANSPDGTLQRQSSEELSRSRPKTLFILDSSYNPPSRAHLALASSAFSITTEPEPHRLLLLFSTHNADKAPKPASFAQRLAMMVVFAQDLQSHALNKSASSDPHSRSPIPVDVGLTTAPYYTDKSISISSASPCPYPSSPTHIHLLGYDTLTRFLAPKYYENYKPPLSALAPFFDPGHKLLVLLRPNSSSDSAVTGDTEDEQRAYIEGLAKGNLADEGMKTEWAKQIGILEGEETIASAGISSTAIRRAVKNQDWDEVRRMCTPGVAAWIRDQDLYREEI